MSEGILANDRLVVLNGNAVTADTNFEARISIVASIPVTKGRTSERVRIAITISSSAAFAGTLAEPLMVHSTCRAPPITPASELATAIPRSS